MSTRDLIEKIVNGVIKTNYKRVSSVFLENGVFYSYGYHYPLMIKTSAGWVVNDRGYSNTTAKHINWCRPYAIGSVHFYHNGNPTENGVIASINDEMEILREKIKGLSKRAWLQKEMAENRLNSLEMLKNKIID